MRVDDPDDVVHLDALGPCGGDTAGAWKDEGNAHFARREYGEAEWCYGRVGPGRYCPQRHPSTSLLQRI